MLHVMSENQHVRLLAGMWQLPQIPLLALLHTSVEEEGST